MIIARLAGRCANGAERDGGKLFHILTTFSEFGTALCGATPGKTSGGWCESPGEATCIRCKAKAERQATKD